MTRKRLSQIDAIKLADWLREKQSEIEHGMTGAQIARIVQHELGILATSTSVIRIGGSLGITFKDSTPTYSETSGLHIVAQSVATLYESLGEVVPEALADLIR